jgi:DNA-binding response OmpR family regulator
MKMSILSVSASEAMNRLLQFVFQNKYEITCLPDVYNGMKVIRSTSYVGLVIVDIDLAEKENLDFIEYIRGSRLHKKPLIILTSENDTESLFKGDKDIYVFKKPFDPVKLSSKVDDIINSGVFTKNT